MNCTLTSKKRCINGLNFIPHKRIMRKVSLTIVLVIIAYSKTYSQTVVPGGYVSGTWTLAGSPYLIQGSIMIPNDSTLTIEPGVMVNFQGTYKLLVLGRLLAIGTVTDTITFTASDTTNGWRSIRFDGTPVTNDTSKILYCKVQYGKATGVPPDDHGGAFYFNNFSRVLISHCYISHCRADEAGGGIYCTYSSPVIIYNTISYNLGVNVGGGICCHITSDPVILHNTITHNTTIYNGGSGISCISGNPVIMDNMITFNTNATYSGGGIWCNGSNAEITGNTISNNSAPFGGGINTSGGNPIIMNNTITNNTANDGGGILCTASNPVITNNTIANNSAVNGGALYCQMISHPTLRNTILWGNNASTSGQQVYLSDEGSDPDFNYCDVKGGVNSFGMNFNIFTGIYQNNIDLVPGFVAPSAGYGISFNGIIADWTVQDGSPCINSGDPGGIYPATDKAGNPRVVEGRIDIGAYEYQWPVGINTANNEDALLLYPNPARDYLVIENSQETLLEMSNINGQIVNTIHTDDLPITIFVGNLPGGVYVIKFTRGNSIMCRKFVKL